MTASTGDPIIPNVDHLLVKTESGELTTARHVPDQLGSNMNTNNKAQIGICISPKQTSPHESSQIKLCSGQGYENSIKFDPLQKTCHKIRRIIIQPNLNTDQRETLLRLKLPHDN